MARRRHHRGLTLLEILLVLALLVIIGAIASPAIGRFVETQQLRDSASLIRGEWARARVQAMKSGRIHVFRYEPSGKHFVVDFWMAQDDLLEAGDDTAVASPAAGEVPWDAEALPDGVTFAYGQAEAQALEEQIATDVAATTNSATGIGWSPPVLFYSDGTTSSADVVLMNDRGNAIRITLRGLTGIGTVSDVFSLEVQPTGDAP